MTRKLKLCISVFEICHVVRFLVLYGVYGEGIWWWKQRAIVLKVSAPISWWCSASRSYTNAYMCNMLQYYKVRLPKELQDYKFACVIPIERGVRVSVYVVFVCVHRATFRVRFRMSNKHHIHITHNTHTLTTTCWVRMHTTHPNNILCAHSCCMCVFDIDIVARVCAIFPRNSNINVQQTT